VSNTCKLRIVEGRSIALQQQIYDSIEIIEIDRHHIFCIAMNPLDPDSSIESNSVARSHHSIERQFGKTRSRSVAERKSNTITIDQPLLGEDCSCCNRSIVSSVNSAIVSSGIFLRSILIAIFSRSSSFPSSFASR
jgi:hypothetical protein